MTEKIMENVWKKMKAAGNVAEEDKEIYLFGFYQGMILLLNIVTTLSIGIILNMFLESILFLICFIPLRIFAGGYHAKTQLRCYIMSTITTVFILNLIALFHDLVGIIGIVCYITALCIIWKLAPVPDKNKPLDWEEETAYRKKVHKILIILTGILGISYFFENRMISSVIEVSVCFLSIILVMGVLKNKKLQKGCYKDMENEA